MRDFLRRHREPTVEETEETPSVLAATHDVDRAASTPTEIDADEFEQARKDPDWREFVERAEDTVASHERERVS